MSTLFVDTINEKTTNNGVEIPGHVIQTVHATTNSRTSVTGAGTFTSLLTLNITPKSSSSKIFITCMFNGASTNRYAAIKLFRTVGGTSTQIAKNSDASGNRTPVWFEVFGNHQVWTTDQWQFQTYNHNGMFYDSPSTTSQITYAIHGGNTTNSGTLWMNRQTYGDDDAAWNHYPQTNLTAREIGG